MKKIKLYSDFIKESSAFSPGASFGHSDLSTINTGGGSSPSNPDLEIDGWDMHKNNMRDQLKRMSDILVSVFTSGEINFSQQLVEIIEDLTIVKVFRNNNGSLDVYLKFFYEEEVFYGVFKNWGTITEPKFSSRIFDIPVIGNYKENRIKIENILKHVLENWFRPAVDDYIALKDVKVYSHMGSIHKIPKGGKIRIEQIVAEDHKPEIHLIYSETLYILKGLDYYFFNWWFDAKEKQEFYL